jgi:pimeloyl-ACP methyl ester carboxylesterase
MLNQSLRELIFIRTVILLLHSIGPLCAAYTATLARRFFLCLRSPSDSAILSHILEEKPWTELTVLQWYCVAETAFYLFFLWYRRHLNKEATHPELRSREEREKLFEKVRREIRDPVKFLRGWFCGAKLEEIGREGLREFLAWAFWEGRVEDGEEKGEELEGLIEKVEEMVGHRFKPGKGEARSLRLTLDPVEMECRSLFWYGVIMLVDTIAHLRLLAYGFGYFYSPATSFEVFPPRPLAAATAKGLSASGKMAYWFRPHAFTTRLPVLYFHGIGAGLHPHVEFLHELDEALNEGREEEDKVGILALEVLQISSRLTHAILTREELLEEMKTILDHLGWEEVVLVSHSYGSVLSTHILTDPALSSRIAHTLLVDPVTILLHMPDVAYNFTVRKPKHANEWRLWYFASKDPGVAHTLGRHFHWSQNILWRSRIEELVQGGMKMTVSLARRDLIVDTEAVGRYLMEKKAPESAVNGDVKEQSGKEEDDLWKKRPWKGEGLEILWWDTLDHAQVFDEKATRAKLINVLVEYCKSK